MTTLVLEKNTSVASKKICLEKIKVSSCFLNETWERRWSIRRSLHSCSHFAAHLNTWCSQWKEWSVLNHFMWCNHPQSEYTITEQGNLNTRLKHEQGQIISSTSKTGKFKCERENDSTPAWTFCLFQDVLTADSSVWSKQFKLQLYIFAYEGLHSFGHMFQALL